MKMCHERILALNSGLYDGFLFYVIYKVKDKQIYSRSSATRKDM